MKAPPDGLCCPMSGAHPESNSGLGPLVLQLATYESDVLPLGKEVWEHGFTTPDRYGLRGGRVGHGSLWPKDMH